jgi:hypothetical protein
MVVPKETNDTRNWNTSFYSALKYAANRVQENICKNKQTTLHGYETDISTSISLFISLQPMHPNVLSCSINLEHSSSSDCVLAPLQTRHTNAE